MHPFTTELSAAALAIVPNLRVCAVIVRDLDRAAGGLATTVLAADAARALAAKVPNPDAIAAIEPFASWRKVFGAMGLQPSKFRSSVEALARRTLKSGLPLTGIPLVDAYNSLSVTEMVAMGGYDLARLSGNIVIRPMRPDDKFDPLGGEAPDFPNKTNVLVYAQDTRVLCYGLNHRDSRQTAIAADTTDAVFFAETLSNVDQLAARRALEAFARVLQSAGASRSAVFDVPVEGAVMSEKSEWEEII